MLPVPFGHDREALVRYALSSEREVCLRDNWSFLIMLVMPYLGRRLAHLSAQACVGPDGLVVHRDGEQVCHIRMGPDASGGPNLEGLRILWLPGAHRMRGPVTVALTELLRLMSSCLSQRESRGGTRSHGQEC